MAKKKGSKILIAAAVVLIAVAYVAGLYTAAKLPEIRKFVNTPAVPAEGLVAAELSLDGNTVTLADGCSGISFDITPDQAFSVAHGIEGALPPRPLTHDIFIDTLRHYNISVLQIRIDRFEDAVYKAHIVLFAGGKMLEMDARPSDSIALATRLNMTVYIDRGMLAQTGKDVCG